MGYKIVQYLMLSKGWKSINYWNPDVLDVEVFWYSSINEYVVTIHETSMLNNLFNLVIQQYFIPYNMKSKY